MKQLINLMSQHRFYAAVCIIGTAVTLAFVMVVVMVYNLYTADMAPEMWRSRSMHHLLNDVSYGDKSNMMALPLGPKSFHALYDSLPGVEACTWYARLEQQTCAKPASSDRHNVYVRAVAGNWFALFSYRFVAGRPFNEAEYEAGHVASGKSDDGQSAISGRSDGVIRRFAVVDELLARRLFGGAAEAVGQEMLLDFLPTRIVGVVADVSSVFPTAYADVWVPVTLEDEESFFGKATDGLGGVRHVVACLENGTSLQDVRKEIEHRVDRLNRSLSEHRMGHRMILLSNEELVFGQKSGVLSERQVYALLVLVLLVVPAVGMAGLLHVQMQSRQSEIAIRKAYGASNIGIIGQLFAESLATTLVGGLLGYGLSCLLVWGGSTWLLGDGRGMLLLGMDSMGASSVHLTAGLMLRPSLFFMALGACVILNALSTLLPAWQAVRRSISYTLSGGE